MDSEKQQIMDSEQQQIVDFEQQQIMDTEPCLECVMDQVGRKMHIKNRQKRLTRFGCNICARADN